MAVVWRALDTWNRAEVAIKLLRPQYAHNVIQRSRFVRSATIMASIKHNAVVRVLDQQTEDRYHCFFAMELIQGGTDFRKAVMRKEVHLEQATSLLLRVGAALTELHGQGLVHRNLRPENILLDSSLAPRLIDFELYEEEDSAEHGRATVYIAPEMRENPQAAGAASDVYSLAMLLAFAIRGTEPTLAEIREGTMVKNLPCDHTLKDLLLRGLDPTPHKRFRDAQMFCDALGAVTGESSSRIPLPASEFDDGMTYLPPQKAEFDDGPTRLPTPSTDFDYETAEPSVVMGDRIGTSVLDEYGKPTSPSLVAAAAAALTQAPRTGAPVTRAPTAPARAPTSAPSASTPKGSTESSSNRIVWILVALIIVISAIAAVVLMNR